MGLRLTIEFVAAMEERQRRPQHHRRGQGKLEPDRSIFADPAAQRQAQHWSHGQHQQRDRERGAHPESPAKVDQFRVWTFVTGRHAHRLQRHAAERAGTRLVAHDLRMHRTGILRSPGHRGRGRAVAEICRRRGFEFLLAARRAEIVLVALIAQKVLRAGAVHRHAANRIDGGDIGLRGVLEPGAATLAAEMIQAAGMLRTRLAGDRIDDHAADGIADDRRRLGGRRLCPLGRGRTAGRAVLARMIVAVMMMVCHASCPGFAMRDRAPRR